MGTLSNASKALPLLSQELVGYFGFLKATEEKGGGSGGGECGGVWGGDRRGLKR